MRKTTFFKTMLAAVMLLVGSVGVWGQYTGTGTFNKITTVDEIVSGGYYVFYGINGTYTGALSNEFASGRFKASAVSPTGTSFVDPAAAIVWKVVGNSTNGFTVYNEASDKYCEITANSTSGFAANNPSTHTYAVTVLDGNFTFKSNSATGGNRVIALYQTDFRPYASGFVLNLYKKEAAVDPNTVAAPIIQVAGIERSSGIYFNNAQVTLSTSTQGASVYYTLNGDVPTAASTLYTAPFNVTSTATVKAIGIKAAMTNSTVTEKVVTIVAPSTATAPYAEAFNNTLGDWYAYQVAGNKPWGPSANGAYINGYGGGDVESWLISPQFSSPLAGLALSFNYATKYAGNPVSVRVSQNYAGYGNPTAATWTELSSLTAVADNYVVKATGDIITPLSGNLHFALVYDTDANFSDWRITNASVAVAPAPNTPTITVTEVSMPAFHAIVGRKDTVAIHVSAVNLTADVALAISGTDAAQFKVEPATLAHTDGTLSETSVNVIYQPTAAGTHVATLTISSTGATSKVYDLSGAAFVTNGAGTVDNPFTVADVKALNNNFASTTKYWVAGYIIGVPSAGNAEGNLTTVALTAPFTSATAIALSDAQNETDLTKMIGVQLPSGAVRTALNLVDNATNLNKKVKAFGNLQAYFSSAPGVQNTSDYILDPNALPAVDAQQFKVYAASGRLYVMAADNEHITVMDVLGKQVYSNRLKAGLNSIELPAKGIMVVKIGNAVKKVIL